MLPRLGKIALLSLPLGIFGCRQSVPSPALASSPGSPLARMTPGGWPLGSSISTGGNEIGVTGDWSIRQSDKNRPRGETEEMVLPFPTGTISLIRGPMERRGTTSRPRSFRPEEVLVWRDGEERRLRSLGGYRRIDLRTTVHRVKNDDRAEFAVFPCRRWEYTLKGQYRIMLLFDQAPFSSVAEVQAANRHEAERLTRRIWPIQRSPEPDEG